MISNSGHIPVLYQEILEYLMPPLLASAEPRYFDGTFGRGGHLFKIFESFSSSAEMQALVGKTSTQKILHAVAYDRDLQAIEFGQQNFSSLISGNQLRLMQKNFSEFSSEKEGLFDAMLVDLGVSSPQLDQAERGFSFYHDGPLDMRMDTTKGITAADIIADYEEEDLIALFKNFGEIFKPYRVVRALVHDRKTKRFETTRELASLIERVEGWRKKGFHPATQYFMALRLAVNGELEAVEQALEPLILGLRPGGRLSVLTFHSLEDRIVKNVFRSREDLGRPLNKKVIQAGREEEVANPRSRSAKLRVFERAGPGDEFE